MTDIAQALTELGIQEWVLRGEPTSKAEFATMYAKVTGADANGSAIESSNEADWGTTWEAVLAKKEALIAAQPMKQLRQERDTKLAETDWMGNSDVTRSDAWTTYRTALRNVPAQGGFPNSITWPTKPS